MNNDTPSSRTVSMVSGGSAAARGADACEDNRDHHRTASKAERQRRHAGQKNGTRPSNTPRVMPTRSAMILAARDAQVLVADDRLHLPQPVPDAGVIWSLICSFTPGADARSMLERFSRAIVDSIKVMDTQVSARCLPKTSWARHRHVARDDWTIDFVQPDTGLDADEVAQLLSRGRVAAHVTTSPICRAAARLPPQGCEISMLIRSIARCLAAIALAYCAASAGTFTRKIMRNSPIVSRTPMMPNGYATAYPLPVRPICSGAALNVASIY